MISKKIAEVYEFAREYDSKLRADDPRLARTVMLYHQDGSMMVFANAFAAKHKGQYIVIFTEHHGFHVYEQEDIKKLMVFEYSKIQIESL